MAVNTLPHEGKHYLAKFITQRRWKRSSHSHEEWHGMPRWGEGYGDHGYPGNLGFMGPGNFGGYNPYGEGRWKRSPSSSSHEGWYEQPRWGGGYGDNGWQDSRWNGGYGDDRWQDSRWGGGYGGDGLQGFLGSMIPGFLGGSSPYRYGGRKK
ncbi:unnamed protein product [Haemonchus placei]|uniref:Shematrin-like protein 1 n=1 Tax=Haemonchus placei TaxID=6290 RepID=A0A0N4W826_HAEPC|nr:unnamed protein product [Haemonchus placei]